ncbi:MAG: sensor histidine kinase [Segetibacter sp.]
MKISSLIFISIFFILLMFSITTYVNYKQSEEVRANAEFLSQSGNIVRQSSQLQRNILYMERGLKRYMSIRENYLLQTTDTTSLENQTLLNELFSIIPVNSNQFKRLDEIKNLYNQWFEEFARPIIEIKAAKDSVEQNLSVLHIQKTLKEQDRLNQRMQMAFRELLNVEYTNRIQRRTILERSEQQTKLVSILLTALSIVVGFVIAMFLARHISRRISKMVNMANNIAEGNYKVQVKDKSNDELSELSRSLNHMAGMLEENITLLKRKNLELDQFAHIVSHDLKTPLRGIDNVISWIEEDYLHEIPPTLQEYLQLIKGRVLRLENLIKGILSFARIGRDLNEIEEINVSDLVHEIVEAIPIKTGVSVTIDKNMPFIHAEKILLTQIFTNLISNAIKYHDKANGEVKIYSKEDTAYYEFFVEDDGPGIDKKYHDKIFVIFQTLQERDSFESTGVGLAIVKKILDGRKEQIKIISEPGKGFTFSFTWSKKY